jgi:acid stress-induced BolA-like protein IbaG/YrbA
MNEKLLEDALQGIALRNVSVRVEGRPGHWVAEVSSPDFAARSEFDRQQIVWEQLQRTLSDDQRLQVEFVVAIAPGEDGSDSAKLD